MFTLKFSHNFPWSAWFKIAKLNYVYVVTQLNEENNQISYDVNILLLLSRIRLFSLMEAFCLIMRTDLLPEKNFCSHLIGHRVEGATIVLPYKAKKTAIAYLQTKKLFSYALNSTIQKTAPYNHSYH